MIQLNPNRVFAYVIPISFFVLLLTVGLVFADGTTPIPAGTGGGVPGGDAGGTAVAAVVAGKTDSPGMMGMLLPFLLMFGILYFLIIRPQQKRVKKHQTVLSTLKQGDEVVTASGILGTIRGLTEKVITLEIAENVKIKILKNQVSQVVKGQVKDLELAQ